MINNSKEDKVNKDCYNSNKSYDFPDEAKESWYHTKKEKNDFHSEIVVIYNYIPAFEKKFNEFAAKWKKETGGYSTTIHITRNDNYLDIIGMGPKVIPLILKDLEKEPDYWFAALKHLTHADPVQVEHLGDIESMSNDWIEWGKKNNYLK